MMFAVYWICLALQLGLSNHCPLVPLEGGLSLAELQTGDELVLGQKREGVDQIGDFEPVLQVSGPGGTYTRETPAYCVRRFVSGSGICQVLVPARGGTCRDASLFSGDRFLVIADEQIQQSGVTSTSLRQLNARPHAVRQVRLSCAIDGWRWPVNDSMTLRELRALFPLAVSFLR